MKKNIPAFLCIILAISLAFPMASLAETKFFDKEVIHIDEDVEITSYIHGFGTAWYGGGVNCGQVMRQIIRLEDVVRQVHEQWKQQVGNCPSDAQITKVIKEWYNFEEFLQRRGFKKEITVLSATSFQLGAPGPKIVAAIIAGITNAASAITPWLLLRNFGGNNNYLSAEQQGGDMTQQQQMEQQMEQQQANKNVTGGGQPKKHCR